MESKNCPCCYKTYPLSFFVPDTGNNNKVFSTCINCGTRSRQYRNESRTETPNSETCASGIVRTMDLRNKRLAYNDRSSPPDTTDRIPSCLEEEFPGNATATENSEAPNVETC